MVNNMDRAELKNLISNFLDSIPEVEYLDEGNVVRFCKNKSVFGKIENNKIYLLDAAGRFTAIAGELLKDKDNFLRAATKAYWLASGMKVAATTA